ncbi:hypothetical protein C8R45DRAFT_1156761 [Mycena sanguinolenta]|nr:hypothetical protein C8R45DRAFT_1156761 [Mycena sanguinolenta]
MPRRPTCKPSHFQTCAPHLPPPHPSIAKTNLTVVASRMAATAKVARAAIAKHAASRQGVNVLRIAARRRLGGREGGVDLVVRAVVKERSDGDEGFYDACNERQGASCPRRAVASVLPHAPLYVLSLRSSTRRSLTAHHFFWISAFSQRADASSWSSSLTPASPPPRPPLPRPHSCTPPSSGHVSRMHMCVLAEATPLPERSSATAVDREPAQLMAIRDDHEVRTSRRRWRLGTSLRRVRRRAGRVDE